MRSYLLFTAILFTLYSCNTPSTPLDHLQEAARLSKRGKYLESVKLLDKVIAKDANFVAAYINRGNNRSALKDYRGAIADYQHALSIDPNNTLALFSIGNSYKKLEQYKKSIQCYNTAFTMKGGGIPSIDYKPKKAVGSEFDVPDHKIYFERAIAFYHIDSLDRSLADFQRAIAQKYMTGDSYRWMGNILLKKSQKNEACYYFQEAKLAGNKEADYDMVKYCYE
jgi:tetratricopeptide (TPR) repeat protein